MESEKQKIFIVDNTDFKDELSKKIAETNEFEVVGICSDGVEAETKVMEINPDVVVMDMVLPSQDGFLLVEKIRRKMGFNKPKIVVATTLSHEGFISKAISIGVNYYLVKPTSTDNVIERIKDVLKMKDEHQIAMQKQKLRQLEEKISNIFITVGIPAHIKGYQFLREAIKMAIETPDIINSITKKLYPAIAEKFETSSSKVETAIRHAIEVAWNRGKIENINNIFGLKVYTSQEKPTNGEFIALVADKMIIEGA